MTRRFGTWVSIIAGVTILLFSTSANAGAIDDSLYSANVSVVVSSKVEIDNGIFEFTQLGIPGGETTFQQYGYFVPGDQTPTDVGFDIRSNPADGYGLYRSFSSQYPAFIGTYGTNGVAMLLSAGVGVGQTFDSLFPNFSEDQVFSALVDVQQNGPFVYDPSNPFGPPLSVSYSLDYLNSLFNDAASLSPTFIANGIGGYTLGPAELVGFSGGTVIGDVSGGIQFTTAPEPSSFALLTLGGIGLAIGAYRRRRFAV